MTSICSIELILKLDSGKGWDIQPTSRWTNMPTLKSSTATIAVADISVPPRRFRLAGDLVRICFGRQTGNLSRSARRHPAPFGPDQSVLPKMTG
jgi:hypothetical protein